MPAILWSAFIFYVSLLPGKKIETFQVNDKLAHIGVYWLLGVFMLFPLLKKIKIKYLFAVLGYVFFMGLGIEYLQENYCSNRHFDWWDVVANFSGALIAVVMIFSYSIYRK